MAINFNVQYNIPRVMVQLPAKQNRLTDGSIHISPSMTEVISFSFGNIDGVPISLVPFKVHFVVWEHTINGTQKYTLGEGNILLNKKLVIDDPYSGNIELVLTGHDTQLLGNHSSGIALHWSLFMVNNEGNVFPIHVSSQGGRIGNLHVDNHNGLPLAELIRGPLG